MEQGNYLTLEDLIKAIPNKGNKLTSITATVQAGETQAICLFNDSLDTEQSRNGPKSIKNVAKKTGLGAVASRKEGLEEVKQQEYWGR
jgi:hypothetical protein